MSQSVLTAFSEYPWSFIPWAKPAYSLSRISFFFLPIARRLGQLRVDGRDLLPPVLAVGVVVVRVRAHRAGPVERADRGDVVELGGGHAAQQVAHRPTVQLEHP